MRITISGKPGAGKTTIAKLLAKKLKLKYIEMGKIAQGIALKRRLTIGELMQKARVDPSIDEEIDAAQKNVGKTQDNFIIDGRISFFFIPDAIHVFLDVDERVAAERIFKKKREPDEPQYKSVEDVQKDIHERLLANQEQYLKYYGVDYLDQKKYRIILDTTNKTKQEIVKELLERISKRQK